MPALSILFIPGRQPFALRVSTNWLGNTLTGLKIGLSSQPLRATTLIRCRGLSYDFVSLGSSMGDSSSLMKRLSLSISRRAGVFFTFPPVSLVFSCPPRRDPKALISFICSTLSLVILFGLRSSLIAYRDLFSKKSLVDIGSRFSKSKPLSPSSLGLLAFFYTGRFPLSGFPSVPCVG
jgi:hypothetical protein